MQAWPFPHASSVVPRPLNMTKDSTLSQALNNRLSDDPVFFVYDHNMLKKEEDDLKDAILYFSPEYMSADDQCALCGQLMGMAEFLSASISQSTPMFFKFDHEKFSLKRIGSYCFGLQASVSVPDSVISEQLMSLCEVFVTFHGSVDSVRLRFKDSHAHFLKEFSNIWRVILKVSNVSLHSTVSQTFNHVPCIQLPKSGSHLFSQASHLLQSSQRRPFVLAGAIFYKNKVLCTQLSPALTHHLTYLQNQIPYIARSKETDMPKGCKTITMFLTDEELKQITPLHINTNKHCKSTNFYQPLKANNPETKHGKKLTRRLTCSSVPAFSPDKISRPPGNVTEQSMKRYIRNERLNAHHGKHGAISVEQSSWGKNKSKFTLSHDPLVECQTGESPMADDRHKLGELNSDPHMGQTYQQLEWSQHLNSFDIGASARSSISPENIHKVEIVKADIHAVASHKQVNEAFTDVDKSTEGGKDVFSSQNDTENKDGKRDVNNSASENIRDENINLVVQNRNGASANSDTDISKDKDKNDEVIDNNELLCTSPKQSKNHIIENVNTFKTVVTKDHQNKVTFENGTESGICTNRSDANPMEVDINLPVIEGNCLHDNASIIGNIKQETMSVKGDSPRLISESELETDDEMETVTDTFIPCIACLDLNTTGVEKSKSTKIRCEKCRAQPSVREVVGKTGKIQEIIDFGDKVGEDDSDLDETDAQSDVENQYFYSAKSEAVVDKAALSSFSSDVSTDSTISRYWTYEMEGLNDVTLYVQCHSEISLLLIMENPEQYEENLFHSLWKGSLAHLADLDYHIADCLEGAEGSENDVNYKYARFDAFSSELHTNIKDVPVKKRETNIQQMLSVLHSDFKERRNLTNVTLRSQSACCHGHRCAGDETFFQPELPNRPVSGLPLPRDPAFNLDVVAKQRLAEDKKMTVL